MIRLRFVLKMMLTMLLPALRGGGGAVFAAEGVSAAMTKQTDPYQGDGPYAVSETLDTWKDEARNREMPVKIYAPKPDEVGYDVAVEGRGAPYPVIVFSHGLGGSRETYAYLGRRWASWGYVCVHLQHHGSDDAIWFGNGGGAATDDAGTSRSAELSPDELRSRILARMREESAPKAGATGTPAISGRGADREAIRSAIEERVRERMEQGNAAAPNAAQPNAAAAPGGAEAAAADPGTAWMIGRMKTGANLQTAINRIGDVKFAVERLKKMNEEPGPWQGKLDLTRVGMAGHSYGAWTTLAALGETAGTLPGGFATPSMAVPGFKAGIAMSSFAGRPGAEATAYAGIKTPILHMTGTQDALPMAGNKASDRRIAFDHIAGADQYLVTFEGGDHMVFAGVGRLIPSRGTNDVRIRALTLAATTAFWDAYLKDDAKAKAWLDGGDFGKNMGADGKLEMKLEARKAK